ncbi:MAG: EAL domain-containing protein, partial [Acidimicrobiales bacterium]
MIILVVGSVCLALGLSVIWKGDASETAAGFWPPAGAALVALIVVPPRRWGWVFGGVLVPTIVGFVVGLMPIVAGCWWAAGNCVEPALAAIVVRRFASSRRWTPNRALLVFFAIGVVIAPMLGGAIGAVGNVVGYNERWLDVWSEWVLGDGLGVLVVAPLLLNYRPSKFHSRTRYEVAALMALVTVATGLAFANVGQNGAALLPYLILVCLIWAGMRFGGRSVAAAGFVVALGANVATSLGYGPFSATQRTADIITLQIFLAIALVTSFVVASMASELADGNEVSRLLTYQAHHDALTGLPNRILFVDRLNATLAAVGDEPGSGVAVFTIDLDDFKKINDRFGSPVGDSVLCSVAEILGRTVSDGDVLARLGGDKFVILCTGLSGPDAVLAAATKLTLSLAVGVAVGANHFQLNASIGAAFFDGDDPITAVGLIDRAEIALRDAKRTPGLNISLFDDALAAHIRRRAEMAEELRHAIDRGEMTVLYQPVISLASGRLTEFEALLRWNNRHFGAVGPDEFIPVAEANGLIHVLGEWVLVAACQQLASWRAQSFDDGIAVAVNVSARQLSDDAFADRVRAILAAAELPSSALTLEITETAVMDDSDASDLVLQDLRQLGVRLSMDDFGTGYSSMSNLRRTPLDVLKIDRSFVAGVGIVAKDTAIVASIIDLGHSFGLDVVAEGIE